MLAGPAVPSRGPSARALGKGSAAPGGRRHESPVVVENGDPLGGLQFQICFVAAAIGSVIGAAVAPSSRLYLGGNGDSLVGTSAARATDSTFRVLAVDLRPVTGEGDTLYEPVRSIPPGNDPLFSLVVGLADAFPSLPDTIRLSLEEVFFSTPSGSTDIAVVDTTNAILVVRETP